MSTGKVVQQHKTFLMPSRPFFSPDLCEERHFLAMMVGATGDHPPSGLKFSLEKKMIGWKNRSKKKS